MLSLSNINVVFPDPKVFFWIATSVADATAMSPEGTKTILVNGFKG